MVDNYYEDVKASLLVFCRARVAELNPSVSTNLAVEYFDAKADPALMPETDLIGPYQFEMDDDGQLITVRTMILLSTIDDENLFRLDALVGRTYAKLRPDMEIPLIDSGTGVRKGRFYILPGVSVLPLDYSTPRPMKAIALEIKADLAAI